MLSAKGIILAAALAAVFLAASCGGAQPQPAPPASAPSNPQQAGPTQSVPEITISCKSTELGEAFWETMASPDGRRYASIVLLMDDDGSQTIIIDGTTRKGLDAVKSAVFSPDSKHIAYTGTTKEGKTILVVDGTDTPIDGRVGAITFSPDSKRLAYFVAAGDKIYSVSDGVRGKEYDGYGLRPVFSPDSKHFAYAARRGDKWLAVIDGKEGKEYDSLKYGRVGFSQDSKHAFYEGWLADKGFLIIDDKEIPGGSSPAFSPDGQHIAYITETGEKKCCVVRDDKPGKTYDSIGQPAFSPNSKHLSYTALSGNESFIISDEVEGRKYENVGVGVVIYSPDSQHLAAGFENMLIVDGIEYKVKYRPGGIIFSPDSKRTACIAIWPIIMDGGWYRIIIDGAESEDYATGKHVRSFDRYEAVFSPDSKHVAYCVTSTTGEDARGRFIVVDGKEVVTEVVPLCAPIFDSPTKFHFIGTKDDKVFLVEVEISE